MQCSVQLYGTIPSAHAGGAVAAAMKKVIQFIRRPWVHVALLLVLIALVFDRAGCKLAVWAVRPIGENHDDLD